MVAAIKHSAAAVVPSFLRKSEEPHQYGIVRIYSPDDGRKMGLKQAIEDVIRRVIFRLNAIGQYPNAHDPKVTGCTEIARKITNAENGIPVTVNLDAVTEKGSRCWA